MRMANDSIGFGCSYFSPDGDRCTIHGPDEDADNTGIDTLRERDNRCTPDDCPLLEDLMLGGDLFSG